MIDQLTLRGQSLEERIEHQRTLNPGLSEEKLIEEVIAEACEMMLNNSDAIEHLARKDMGLAEYIAHWLEKFYAMVRDAFAGVGSMSAEAKLLTKAEADGVVRYVDELQKLWDDALVGAVENGRTNRDSGDVDMKQSRENITNIGIEKGLTDTERYEILKDAVIVSPNAMPRDPMKAQMLVIEASRLNHLPYKEVEDKLSAIAKKQGLIGDNESKVKEMALRNEYLTFDVSLSRKSLAESLKKQGKNIGNFRVLLPVLKESFEKAVPILVQGDRYRHVVNDNENIEAFAYLLGSFNWGNKKIPVQYELKKFNDGNQSRIYVVATIKEDALIAGRNLVSEEPNPTTASTTISIKEIVKEINTTDARIWANFPSQMLTETQRAAKTSSGTTPPSSNFTFGTKKNTVLAQCSFCLVVNHGKRPCVLLIQSSWYTPHPQLLKF